MALYAPKRQYENHPEGEDVPLVCVDCVDKGMVVPKDPKFKPSHKIQYVFQSRVTGKNGNRLTVRSRLLTLSTHERSSFRKFAKDWGIKMTDAEWALFDFESLIGRMAEADIVHNQVGENVYANIDAIRKYKGEPFTAEGYVRVKDRELGDDSSTSQESTSPADDDVPF